MTKTFNVFAPVCGKGRPRGTVTNGHVRMYTPSKTAEYEYLIRMEYLSQCENYRFDDVPLWVDIIATFEPPASLSEKKRQALIGQPHTKKPDLDNVVKIVMDSCNGVAFHDDNQVVRLLAEKKYGERSCLTVTISEYKGGEPY